MGRHVTPTSYAPRGSVPHRLLAPDVVRPSPSVGASNCLPASPSYAAGTARYTGPGRLQAWLPCALCHDTVTLGSSSKDTVGAACEPLDFDIQLSVKSFCLMTNQACMYWYVSIYMDGQWTRLHPSQQWHLQELQEHQPFIDVGQS